MSDPNTDYFSRRLIPDHLNREGFSLPDVGLLEKTSLSSITKVKNVEITGLRDDDSTAVFIPTGFGPPNRLRIRISASAANNLIVFGPNCQAYGDILISGSNNSVFFSGEDGGAGLYNISINSNNSCFYLGRGGTSNGLSIFIAGDSSSVSIGEGVLVAHDVKIYTSDMHALFDATSGDWINPPASVVIEPHVWLGRQCTIMKGSHIGFGSVIGLGSVLSGKFEKRVVAAGVPARIIRRNTTWVMPNYPYPEAIAALRDLEQRLGV